MKKDSNWYMFTRISFGRLPERSFFEWVKLVDTQYPVRLFTIGANFQMMQKPKPNSGRPAIPAKNNDLLRFYGDENFNTYTEVP